MTIKQKLKDLHTLGVFNEHEYKYLKLLVDIDITKDKLKKAKSDNNVHK